MTSSSFIHSDKILCLKSFSLLLFSDTFFLTLIVSILIPMIGNQEKYVPTIIKGIHSIFYSILLFE
jgi:hypothetical protein